MSQQTPRPINPGSDSTAKGFVANLTKNAGAAAKLVGLQAERTRLTTLTLPAAYRTLGNDCVQQKRHLDGVKELIEQLQAVVSEIKALSEISKPQASNQSFTDKAKAAGKHAVDLARRKQLEMKRESLCGDVGKVIYETYKESSGSKDLVTPIQEALQRVTELDSEIAKLSEVGKGSFITPKRMLVAAAVLLVLFTGYFFFSGNITSGNGFTEKVLSLKPDDLKSMKKRKFPEGAKPLYQAGSVSDFLQSMTLLSDGTPFSIGPTITDTYEHKLGKYQIIFPGYTLPMPVFESLYGKPIRKRVVTWYSTFLEKTEKSDVWEIACSDGKVLLQGDYNGFPSQLGYDYVSVSGVYLDFMNKDFCTDNARKDIHLNY